jgi:hypothetical protein
MDHAWTCGCCGKPFNTILLDIVYHAPDHWVAIPEARRRGKIDQDVCFLHQNNGMDIYLRGVIEIPIIGQNDHFRWGAWVAVTREGFDRALELWTAEVIEDEPPLGGRIGNDICSYPDTIDELAHVHLRPGKFRPAIELISTDHPLAIEQREGISMERVEEIVATCSTSHRDRAHDH